MNNIEIAYDSTDHFSLICPTCGEVCLIKSVKTIKNLQIDLAGNKDNCSYIQVKCRKCKTIGQRKIYWNNLKHNRRDERGRVNWKDEFKKKIARWKNDRF